VPIPDIIVIQPWFSAQGHPAQSTLNLSRIIPAQRVRRFLISSPVRAPALVGLAEQIGQNVPVELFGVPGTNLRTNTAIASFRLAGIKRTGRSEEPQAGHGSLFFVDADLLMICLVSALGIFRRYARVCMVHLEGPQALAGRTFRQWIVRRALRSGRLLVFLRTPELMEDWGKAFPEVAGAFRLLPPVEAAGSPVVATQERSNDGLLRIGVIGQVRIGKCIPALLRVGDRYPQRLRISVCGPLYDNQPEEFLDLMRTHPRVSVGFMTEETMLSAALQQDYLACLFEERIWNVRMESATFWLAVKTLRPVLCFGSGWIGRMVRETGCGIILPQPAGQELPLEAIPGRDSPEYRRCVGQIERLRASLVPENLWQQLERSML
jgi:hypothetical protein